MINEKSIKQGLKEYTEYIIERVNETILQISECPSICLDDQSLRALGQDIAKALTERLPIELVITTCPDYSHDEMGRFTFKDVAGGIGLVGKQSVEAILPLLAILSSQCIHTKVTFTYADLEAVDPDILKSMSISSSKFQELIEQSIVAGYLYLKSKLSENGLTTFITSDAQRMTERFLHDAALQVAEEIVDSLDSYKLTSISFQRTGVVDRMFSKIINGTNYTEVLERRTKKDIQDHIALGNSVRAERINGQPTSIVTLSIPHLTQFLNYTGEHIPVIRIQQNY